MSTHLDDVRAYLTEHPAVRDGAVRALLFSVSDIANLFNDGEFGDAARPNSDDLTAILRRAMVATTDVANGVYLDALRDAIKKHLHKQRTVRGDDYDTVVELALCESRHLLLTPGVTYRFVVIPGCDECERLAAEERGDDPGPMG